ncbi:hypothetical protein BDV12DRAFT_187223 [Aspergillus spectabilis]
MDGYAKPMLTANTVSFQQTQIFRNYVLASFPCHFRCTAPRVSVNWIQYVDRRQGLTSSCFDWAIRACTIAFLGDLHNDVQYMIASHEFYQRGLRGLSHLLSNEATAKSDEALAAAITLAVFEKHACSTPDAWLCHAAGIQTLMKFRGPLAHLAGFGRTMYLFYRSFFLAAALIEGKECFLDEPEWQALSERIAADNAKSPTSSLYTETLERGFLAVSKLPGYFKRGREIQIQQPNEKNVARSLHEDLQAAQAALRGIYTEFEVSVSIIGSNQTNQDPFIGPVPRVSFEGYSRLFAAGLQSALRMLEYLIIITIEETHRATLTSDSRTTLSKLAGNKRNSVPTFMVQSLTTTENKQSTKDWLDHVISTMGLDAVRVSLVDR